jgi:hypothetical protein
MSKLGLGPTIAPHLDAQTVDKTSYLKVRFESHVQTTCEIKNTKQLSRNKATVIVFNLA